MANLKIEWVETPNGNYQTRVEQNGKVYLSVPVPESFAIKMGMKCAQRRSITYQGIADAMAEQWSNL